jgi:uncharacterized protein YuzE
MKVTYDDEAKAMYILGKKTAARNLSTSKLGIASVYMDTNIFGEVVGFELLFKEPLRVNNETKTLLY